MLNQTISTDMADTTAANDNRVLHPTHLDIDRGPLKGRILFRQVEFPLSGELSAPERHARIHSLITTLLRRMAMREAAATPSLYAQAFANALANIPELRFNAYVAETVG